MAKEKATENLDPEAVHAYSNDAVERALRNRDWFTKDYILEVDATEPDPERDGLGPFKDKLLGDFFLANLEVGKGNETYLSLRTYLYERMIGSQGHFFPLKSIPFVDKKLLTYARELGLGEDYEINRGMLGDIQSDIFCLIAPQPIRRQVVRAVCRWGVEYVKRDVLLLAELTRRGTQEFVKKNLR